MDIIARWRDAITDPPPEGWRGLIRNPDEGVTVWFRDYRGKHYAGDQWLDVTDVPAVPLSKVQAAVDMLRDMAVRAMEHPEETNPQATASMRHACRVVMGHTGVTPSEAQ